MFMGDFLHCFPLIAHSSLCSDLFNPVSFRLVKLCFLYPHRLFCFLCVMKTTKKTQYANTGGKIYHLKNHQCETINFLFLYRGRVFVTQTETLAENKCNIIPISANFILPQFHNNNHCP